MKDELIVGEHQVDGTRLLIYLYIFTHRCLIFFCHTYITSKMLLHPVPSKPMYWTNFCMNYIQIVVFLYIILRVTFFSFFCVNNWLS